MRELQEISDELMDLINSLQENKKINDVIGRLQVIIFRLHQIIDEI